MTKSITECENRQFTPSQRLRGLSRYSPPAMNPHVDLYLDANEGTPLDDSVVSKLTEIGIDQLRRYPDASTLESALASEFEIDAERVMVTNGADDAIDRVCRVALESGRELLIHTPTFEMIERSARLSGAAVRTVRWLDESFPVGKMIEAITERTSLVAIVSPNNPTGRVVRLEEMLAIVHAAARVGAVVMVDLAYVEFADCDPSGALLEEPNVIIVRTFSKAMGLAGARVGYALASSEMSNWLRIAGGPYPVSSVSLALAAESLANKSSQHRFIDTVRSQRESLANLLCELGGRVLQSQANFVTAKFADGAFLQRALVSLGISVRMFSERPELNGYLRFTLPGNTEDFGRLRAALRTVLNPEAILFDLDCVLADVASSDRTAIPETARTFGVDPTPGEVGQAGGANNDWQPTKRLIEQRGVPCEQDELDSRFQCLNTESAENPGPRETERAIADPAMWNRLHERYPLGVVTGRRQEEAESLLTRAGLRGFFTTVICMEDAPAKPSPKSVLRAMEELGISRAWMIGATPDGVAAARGSGALPIGVVPTLDDPRFASDAMLGAGAAAVIAELSDIERIIR